MGLLIGNNNIFVNKNQATVGACLPACFPRLLYPQPGARLRALLWALPRQLQRQHGLHGGAAAGDEPLQVRVPERDVQFWYVAHCSDSEQGQGRLAGVVVPAKEVSRGGQPTGYDARQPNIWHPDIRHPDIHHSIMHADQ